MTEAFLDHGNAHSPDATLERLGVAARGNAALARVEAVGSRDDLQQQRIVAHVRGHRPAGIERDLQHPDAGIGNKAEGRLQSDDAAMAGRDADRAGLVAADRHIHVAGGDNRRAAGRRSAGGVAVFARIVHRTGRAGMAAAGHAVIFAHRLAGDLAAGIEDALDHRRIDVRHIAFQKLRADHHRHAGKADIVLERDAAAGELAARPAFDRSLYVPGAVRVLLRRRPVELTAGISYRRQLVRRRVERGICVCQRRDDLLDGIEVGIARIHAELLRCLTQIGDAGFLKHDRSLPKRAKIAAPASNAS